MVELNITTISQRKQCALSVPFFFYLKGPKVRKFGNRTNLTNSVVHADRISKLLILADLYQLEFHLHIDSAPLLFSSSFTEEKEKDASHDYKSGSLKNRKIYLGENTTNLNYTTDHMGAIVTLLLSLIDKFSITQRCPCPSWSK